MLSDGDGSFEGKRRAIDDVKGKRRAIDDVKGKREGVGRREEKRAGSRALDVASIQIDLFPRTGRGLSPQHQATSSAKRCACTNERCTASQWQGGDSPASERAPFPPGRVGTQTWVLRASCFVLARSILPLPFLPFPLPATATATATASASANYRYFRDGGQTSATVHFASTFYFGRRVHFQQLGAAAYQRRRS